MLIVFAVNYISPDNIIGNYFESNIHLYVEFVLQKEYILENWRREERVYLKPTSPILNDNDKLAYANLKIGLARPKQIDGAKAPIYYGYDQILYIYSQISTLLMSSSNIWFQPVFNIFNNQIVPDLNSVIGVITSKYDINFYQLRDINRMVGPELMKSYNIVGSVTRQEYIVDVTENLKDISRGYDNESIDTIIGFDRLSPYFDNLRTQYLNGGTKNFISINNEREKMMVIDEEKLDYELTTDPALLYTKIQGYIQLFNNIYAASTNQQVDWTRKVYKNLNLLELYDYYTTLTHIYHRKVANWDQYRKS